MTLSGCKMSSSLFLPLSIMLKRCLSKNPVLMSSTWEAAPQNSVIFWELNFDINQKRHISQKEKWRVEIKKSLKTWLEIYKLWNEGKIFMSTIFIQDKEHSLKGSLACPSEENLNGYTKKKKLLETGSTEPLYQCKSRSHLNCGQSTKIPHSGSQV